MKYFGLNVQPQKFIDFQQLSSITIPEYLAENIDFSLANRGNTDMGFYACEAFIFPILQEVWKRNPKVKLFSHLPIKYQDTILVSNPVVTPKDSTGLNIFTKPFNHHRN